MARVDILAGAFNGANTAFLTDLYARWAKAPGSVDPSFGALFAGLGEDARQVLTDAEGPSWAPRHAAFGARGSPGEGNGVAVAEAAGLAALSEDGVRATALDSIRALMLIRAYRVRGHLEANLDPLGLTVPKPHAELDPASYGFTEADFDRPIFIANVLGRETATLREILGVLRATYCGPIGVEFMHIQDPDQKSWIQRNIEGAPWVGAFDAAAKRTILSQLTEAEGFETFCQKRFVGTKRFGLEGGEASIPALHAVIERAVAAGVIEIVIGMPHRGRLSTLVNVVKKPLMAVFSEFAGASPNPDDVQGAGDVKYHLGTSTDVEIDGRHLHLSLQPNPSHLEAVDSVVMGKVRARQDTAGDAPTRRKVLGILVHGDAAFAGQGLVYETLAMSKLIGFRTGGTVHLVVNNQIGFTTIPVHAFSGLYCTDVAKSVQSPIFHVNGDDPEAVVYCARLAAEFRHEFGVDVVVDIVCYRRHGHNEADEPAFTQPLMYSAIAVHKTTRALYAEKLAAEGSVSAAEATGMWDSYATTLEQAYEAAQSYKPNKADWLEGHWSGFAHGDKEEEAETGAGMAELKMVGTALADVPKDFDLNPKLRRQLDHKRRAMESGEGIDWATGEALAFGTLLLEGHRVRLSGEDVERGTFSQRHAVLFDQTNQRPYVPLNAIAPEQARLEVYNSPLSEAGVLAFEYGYTLADPRSLVLWEAQFGDFANGAQVIIDQFVASGESKWLRMSGLTLLLPHGYEGQGPEHSSARLERYLQLCAERNMQVCNPTTPANYFHALRRQVRRNFRKPLVLMTPKSLLRHKLAVSLLADMAEGSRFRPVIGEIDDLAPEAQRRVVLCSGKVYYDLYAERHSRDIKDVGLLRLEQFYPFPEHGLAEALRPYAKAELVWCQEEPENMGGWGFVDRRLERVLAGLGRAGERPCYVGRSAAASPATGLAKAHVAEQAALIDRVFAAQ
ncbi:MAG: 2-oxoglutarate dehydrogenase E1 component [Acetobacteraceae bacterium]